MPTRRPPSDTFFIACFALFAFTSLAMEPFVVFEVDLAAARDPLGRAWHLYAARWDPLFLDTPPWLRIMCGLDAFVFGPTYLALIYGLRRARPWVRPLGLVFCGALIYSTLVYFGYELWMEHERANLAMVFLVNVPYTLVPLAFLARLLRGSPAPSAEGRAVASSSP